MNRRTEILRATALAAEVQATMPSDTRSGFDITRAVLERDLPVIYRPLKGLWGATVTVDDDLKGILVTSKLDLHVQRFTLAHELGHVLLGHESSFDEVNSIGFAGRFGPTDRPIQEIAADTFASELLGHRALLLPLAKRHRWTRARLTEPKNIYQLALRLGISYQATCWALASRDILSRQNALLLQRKKLRDLKLQVVPAAILTNSWADTWLLSEADTGLSVEAGPDDLFAVEFQESAFAGYLWELVDAGSHGEIVEDQAGEPSLSQAHVTRTVFVRFRQPGLHSLVFEHRRPWNKARIGKIDIQTDTNGKEQAGFSRRARQALMSEAE